MDFLGDSNAASAMDVVVFVQEIIETNPKLRVSAITRLLDTFYQIRAGRVCSCALWIIGEYCLPQSEAETGIATTKQCLGDHPFYTVTEDGESQDASKNAQPVSSVTVSSRRPVILADGLLASQGNLRSLLLSGDFFLGAVVACALTELLLRLEEVQSSKVEVNKATTQSLLIMVSMLQLGQSQFM
ncbi:hypothetical protein Nepgr_023854 [Nepenthes gracilis]|uniref:Clathrin/coatomer adaptor adaptin-like N-terminal domain-containing protein n=1 Tax=Nepenthes gracilis TaxID=150966 RepID=A0AAD3T528_NEPGR|nr:hypothetical protein Nepgr_023854 [Nepenthes gracilis]